MLIKINTYTYTRGKIATFHPLCDLSEAYHVYYLWNANYMRVTGSGHVVYSKYYYI